MIGVDRRGKSYWKRTVSYALIPNVTVYSDHLSLLAYDTIYSTNKRAGAASGVALLYFFGDRDRHGGYRAESLSLGPCKSPDFD